MKQVVMFSGGVGSWAAAKRVAAQHGTADLTLLFTDTKMEDEDLYRFLHEAAANIGGELVILAEGRTPWQVFFDKRFLGNSRFDPCSLILKRQMADRWLDEHCDPADTIVSVGIDWSEEHRYTRLAERRKPWVYRAPMCEAPYLSKAMMLSWLEAEGIAVPRLYRMGFSHNNCFSGDTRFITNTGIKSLAECVGQEVVVLGFGGGWKTATVQSFGTQTLWKLTVRRYSDTKEIWVTPDHRWFKRHGRSGRDEVLTRDLRPGDYLASMYGQVRHNVRPSAYGIAHGIVFGDGTRNMKSWNNPARVTLCGEKDRALLKWFPLSPTAEVPGVGVEVRDLPRYWKSPPPLNESQSYLYGWLAGYFAADGSVHSDGQCRIDSARLENIRLVRDVAAILGIGTTPIRSYIRTGLGNGPTPLYHTSLSPSGLGADFFLIDAHRGRFDSRPHKRTADWQIVAVKPTVRSDEVFCAVVPDGHVFTLEDNILTGNCGGFCIKAGQAHFANLLRQMPERYAFHEDQEQALRRHLGKDVTILREQVAGEMRPLTLRELRRRIQSREQIDLLDWGGCGCFVDGDDDA